MDSQFHGLWHRRAIDEPTGMDIDVYLLLSADWAVSLGPDGVAGWPDSKAHTDDEGLLWVETDGEAESGGTLTRDGDSLRIVLDGVETVLRRDAKSMGRDEAIAFLAKRYKDDPDAYHNEMGNDRRIVLPPPPR